MPLVCLLIVACGGDSGPTADQACSQVAQARCSLRSMCSNGTRVTQNYGDMNTCVAREKINCLNGLGAPSTGNSPSAVVTCASVLPTEACSDFFLNDQPMQCVVTGKLAMGAACGFSGQCATTFCAIPKGVACGTCQPLPVAGASCATIGCGRGLECDNNTMTCVAPAGMGAQCSRAQPCGSGLSCVGASMTVMGTCQPTGNNAGVTCDPRQQTAPGCNGEIGLYCNRVTMKCALTTYTAAGQPCGTDMTSGNVTGCASGGMCVGASATALGMCVAPAADGAACDTANGPPCLAPARCINGGGATTAGNCQLEDATACH
jgi:hypothetical protein